MKNLKLYATALVLSHLAVNVIHGWAHQSLGINLTSAQQLFVLVVIIAAPLVAMILLWTRARKWGAGLLFLSMSGSLIFGVANHFLLVSADHVSHLPAGDWAFPFQLTAVLLAVTECLGCLLGWLELRAISNK